MREFTALHYIGYGSDAGGIVSVLCALASAGRFQCVLGVNRGFVGSRPAPIAVQAFSQVAGETISALALWRTRTVAREVTSWLAADRTRVYHGHSRAGLLVALWLCRFGERRVAASVHCYGRQRWLYRWAARRLGHRLFWLTPAMKRHYGVSGGEDLWRQCIPGCVPVAAVRLRVPRRNAANGVHLGGIGSLVPWKRWDLVLEALARLPATMRREIRFTHIGAPDASARAQRYARKLKTRAAELGVSERVQFRGEQPSADGLLSEIDALVVAAESEPFSIAMLEALGAGVPVIAADSGGAVDVIRHGRNGWLFRSGDAGDLADIVAYVAGGDALAAVQVDHEELRRFTAPVVADQWAAVYRGILRPE